MDCDIPVVKCSIATTTSMNRLLGGVEDWEHQVATADDQALEDMLGRWNQLGQRLKEDQKQQQKQHTKNRQNTNIQKQRERKNKRITTNKKTWKTTET